MYAHGRIWRLTYEGMERNRTQPRMLNETPAQLVAHLSHPNGWWRDSAQQLLVLKQDKSVVPALQQILKNVETNLLARFHALWTLEGLGALDAATVRAQMKDANPRMRIQAIRASETLYKAGDRSFDADYRAAAVDKDTNVAIQAMLTLNYLKAPNVADTVRAAQAASTARGVQEIGNQILKPATSAFGRGGRGGPPPFSPAELAVMERGEAIYKEVCFACHGDDGRGTSLAGGPAGHDDGAVARELDARAGPSRLRHQDAAARHGRADRRQDLRRRRHGADGHEPRRVDCRDRVLRPQLVRQRRLVRLHRGRRAGARGHGARARRSGRSTSSMASLPTPLDVLPDVEGEREPQPRLGARRAQLRVVDDWRAAATGHVVPGRAAGANCRHRDPVQRGGKRIRGRRRTRPRSRRRTGARQEHRRDATAAGGSLPACIQS